MVAGPCGELDGGAEEIVAFGYGLAGAHADADVDGVVGRLAVLVERALDRDRGFDGAGDRRERRHDPVAGVLDLVAAVVGEPAAHDLVVRAHELHRLGVAEPLRDVGRSHDVGEQDRAERGLGVRLTDGMRRRPGRGSS